MIASYVRVSSKAQDLATQTDAIERCAKARGDVIEHRYAEKMSAKTMGRPALERLRADARAGKLEKLYVFRLDRLTRSGIRDTFELIDELRRHGVELVTVSDGFPLDGPAADVILAVIAWAASMERAAIGERISAARARVEAEGRKWGRPGRLTPVMASNALQRSAKGQSIRQIAAALKVPKSTIGRLVSQKPALKTAA